MQKPRKKPKIKSLEKIQPPALRESLIPQKEAELKSLKFAPFALELDAVAIKNGCILMIDIDTGGCYYRLNK